MGKKLETIALVYMEASEYARSKNKIDLNQYKTFVRIL